MLVPWSNTLRVGPWERALEQLHCTRGAGDLGATGMHHLANRSGNTTNPKTRSPTPARRFSYPGLLVRRARFAPIANRGSRVTCATARPRGSGDLPGGRGLSGRVRAQGRAVAGAVASARGESPSPPDRLPAGDRPLAPPTATVADSTRRSRPTRRLSRDPTRGRRTRAPPPTHHHRTLTENCELPIPPGTLTTPLPEGHHKTTTAVALSAHLAGMTYQQIHYHGVGSPE